ncbi:hypothetical protein ShirakiTB12_39490 [Priestia megaterium]|uniref:HNH endonuclease n=1 Tax=Priestia megaterium TaxID=1404 RepID=A0AAX6BNX0_PRIMG|nr:hypothetical protein [Priestia megaterium]GMG75481.1 hypothetical protein ShirakiTB12_39490 [Priestia megaterium]
MDKSNFTKWLNANTTLSSYSIGRYAGAIDTLSIELGSYGITETSLYNINNIAVIDSIIKDAKFQEKNNKGNRMYSAALNHFKSYIKYADDQEFKSELIKEKVEFEGYLEQVKTETVKSDITDRAQEKPKHKKINMQKVWERNPKYAGEAVVAANYLCEVDSEHKYFVSKFNHQNYVEAHHLIPMKYQDQFNYSLDVHANIVSICLVCHKKLHYGLFKDKRHILEMLFNSRVERLENSGIFVSMDELYSFYMN